MVLYSDGITEAKNKAGELFGLDRLRDAVSQYAVRYGSQGINYHIAKDVTAFIEGHGQDDDMTLIVIKRDSALKSDQEVRDKSTNWS